MTWCRIKIAAWILGIAITKRTYKAFVKKQYNKGLKKYGKTLGECDYFEYNWYEMALEELIDLIQYIDKYKKG